MARLNRLLVSSALALAIQAPLDAAAQESSGFGTERPWVVSLEHLGGLVSTRIKSEGADDTSSQTTAGTFLGAAGLAPAGRLGIHYFVAPPISIGALLTYSDNDSLGDTLLLGARVGAALPLGSSTDIWLRGGIAYFRASSDDGDTTLTDIRPGGEALLAITPLEHFGILAGGMFEIGVAGNLESESAIGNQTIDRDFDYMEFGLTLGVFGNF